MICTYGKTQSVWILRSYNYLTKRGMRISLDTFAVIWIQRYAELWCIRHKSI